MENIDWTTWGSFDEIHLLVCRPVQSEIDNQKNRGNGRVARRATTTYQRFRDIVTGDVGYSFVRADHPRVALYLEAPSRPSPELEDLLDYGKPDDEIVGHCYRYRQENADADVRLLTHDGGAMMAAKSVGVPFEPIPDSWILPAENSAVERENARLKNEVNRLKKAEPEFRIRCLADRGRAVETVDIECQIYHPLAEDDIAELIEALKKRCPVSDDFGPRQLETGPEKWSCGSKAETNKIRDHSCPSRTALKLASALATTARTSLRTTRWPAAPPPVLPDSPILPATRVRLATVAARYSWNFVLTLPK